MIIIYICVFVVCIIYCDSTGAFLLHCCCIAAALLLHCCCIADALLLSQDVSFAHSSQILNPKHILSQILITTVIIIIIIIIVYRLCTTIS